MLEPKILKFTLPTKIVVSPKFICKALRSFENVSDHLLFDYRKGELTISVNGENWQERSYKSRTPTLDGQEHQDSRSLFPMDYWMNMIRSLTSMEDVVMNMGNDLPMKIEGTTEGGIAVGYYLAPRINEQD